MGRMYWKALMRHQRECVEMAKRVLVDVGRFLPQTQFFVPGTLSANQRRLEALGEQLRPAEALGQAFEVGVPGGDHYVIAHLVIQDSPGILEAFLKLAPKHKAAQFAQFAIDAGLRMGIPRAEAVERAWRVLDLHSPDTSKNILAAIRREVARQLDAYATLSEFESWGLAFAPTDTPPTPATMEAPYVPPSQHPDRKEAYVSILEEPRDGKAGRQCYLWMPFYRRESGEQSQIDRFEAPETIETRSGRDMITGRFVIWNPDEPMA